MIDLLVYISLPFLLPFIIGFFQEDKKRYYSKFARILFVCVLSSCIPLLYFGLLLGFPSCVIASSVLAIIFDIRSKYAA